MTVALAGLDLSNGSGPTSRVDVDVARLGDGYSQAMPAGPNPVTVTYRVILANRPVATIDTVITWLETQAAAGFSLALPDVVGTREWRCRGWTGPDLVAPGFASLELELEETPAVVHTGYPARTPPPMPALHPDRASRLTSRVRTASLRLGDSYALVVADGIHAVERSYRMVLAERPAAFAAQVEAWLRASVGRIFPFTLPSEASARSWRCDAWEGPIRDSAALRSLTLDLAEVPQP